ncbi:MAG: SbcC/MukB-like Walker B domain-containing protein, partial [Cyanobacteriota bacterium]
GRSRNTFEDEEELKNKNISFKEELEIFEKKAEDISEEIKKLNFERESFNTELSVLLEINKGYLENKKEINIIDSNIEKIFVDINKNNAILEEKIEIESNYKKLIELKKEDEILLNKKVAFSELEKEGVELRSEISEIKHKLQLEYQKTEDRLNSLNNDMSECEKVLKDKIKVSDGYEKYKKYKEEEIQYQKKLIENQNLANKKYQIEKDIQKELQKLLMKETEIKSKINEKENSSKEIDKVKIEINEIKLNIENLNKKQQHLENIKEEGVKISSNIESNKKLIELKDKDIKIFFNKIEQWKHIEDPNCPMCNTSLDEKDKKIIVDKYSKDIELFENEKDELVILNSKLEKNLKSKRDEFKILAEEIKLKDSLQKKLGEYEQKLFRAEESIKEIIILNEELEILIEKIKNNDFSIELKKELDLIDKKIIELSFSNEEMALITAKVNDFRWAENLYNKIQTAELKYNDLIIKKPEIQEKFDILFKDLNDGNRTREKEIELKNIYAKAKAINYNKESHNEISLQIKELKIFDEKFSLLQEANIKINNLNIEKDGLEQVKNNILLKIKTDFEKIKNIPEIQAKLNENFIKISEIKLSENEIKLKINLIKTELIKINEKLEYYEKLKLEIAEKLEQIKKIDYEIRIHKELVLAFGKNGIQSVIIENVIPEIENVANRLLNKITEGRMNITFTTKKELKSSDKVNETLDIYISDELGTRSYELYSGGEAFRVNFAIRLALSKVLARRSGLKLKTLVIDEGFGTQDSKGISRLIEAINIISSDFEKILIITHMNELKEAFPIRIEVFKTIHGSEIRVLK